MIDLGRDWNALCLKDRTVSASFAPCYRARKSTYEISRTSSSLRSMILRGSSLSRFDRSYEATRPSAHGVTPYLLKSLTSRVFNAPNMPMCGSTTLSIFPDALIAVRSSRS